MNILSRFLVLLMLLSSCALAQDPPRFVWRIDKRPPDELFANGMASWGNNMNVYAHTSGESCESEDFSERTSGFISTSANQTWAFRTAVSMTLQAPEQNVYLYRIRADDTFFSAVTSLQHYAEQNPDAGITDISYIPARQADEYITPSSISNGLIESVTILYSPDGQQIHQNTRQNEHYVSRRTQASTAPYDGTQDVRRRFTWVRYVPLVGACMASRTELRYKEGDAPGATEYRPLEIVLDLLLSN